MRQGECRTLGSTGTAGKGSGGLVGRGATADGQPRDAAGDGPSGPPGDEAERALVRRARRGDREAFDLLLGPLVQPLYQFACRVLGDRDLAEDVVQESLVKAYTGIARFRGEARFSTWVFRIVHNACTDAVRYRARRPQVPLTQPSEDNDAAERELVEPAPGPDAVVLERMGTEVILEAIADLPHDQRVLVVLRDVQGYAYEEVAAMSGEPLGTVKSRLHRARAALRAALVPRGVEPLSRPGVHPGGSVPGAPLGRQGG